MIATSTPMRVLLTDDHMIGAEFTIQSSPREGTRILVSLTGE
jgi:hypothetical protein